MDHFFNLGFNRVFRWAYALILIPFIVSADWSAGDAEYLRLIENNVDHIYDDVSDMLYEMDWFKTKVSSIETLIDAFVSTPDDTSVYTFYSGVKDITNALSSASVSIGQGLLGLSNVVSLVGSDLANHIDNLTNYIGQSQTIPLQPDLMTNLLFISSWHLYTPPTTLTADGYPSDNSIKALFYTMFGRNPTSAELNRYKTLVKRYGQGSQQLFEISSWIDPDHDLQHYSNNYGVFGNYRRNWFSTSEQDLTKVIARVRYHQYGTLPILEFFQKATNDYNLASALVHTPDTGDGEGHSYSSGFVSTVGALAENAIESLPSVSSDDLTPANTNDIDDVGNDSYSNAKQRLFRTDPETAISPEVMSTLNDRTFSSDLANALENADTLPGFTFDLSGFNSFGNSVRSLSSSPNNVTLQLVDIKSSTVQYVDFILDIVDCGLVLIFGCLFWDFLRKETSNWALWG